THQAAASRAPVLHLVVCVPRLRRAPDSRAPSSFPTRRLQLIELFEGLPIRVCSSHEDGLLPRLPRQNFCVAAELVTKMAACSVVPGEPPIPAFLQAPDRAFVEAQPHGATSVFARHTDGLHSSPGYGNRRQSAQA